MNETLDFNTYVSYVLIAAYYVIMLRLWLPPPPPDEGGKAGSDNAAVGRDGKSSKAVLRRVAAPPAGDSREPGRTRKDPPLSETLDRIRGADEHFDEERFLSGASRAYELVVNAYARGDASTLNSLLAPDAAATFCDAIDERRQRGETVTLDFICVRQLDIVDARLDADHAEIDIRFVSELVTVTRAADNAVIDGDPDRIVTMTDLWTFARRVPSSDPNWTIAATGDG